MTGKEIASIPLILLAGRDARRRLRMIMRIRADHEVPLIHPLAQVAVELHNEDRRDDGLRMMALGMRRGDMISRVDKEFLIGELLDHEIPVPQITRAVPCDTWLVEHVMRRRLGH